PTRLRPMSPPRPASAPSFYTPPPPPHLHSFPTRRSSDLLPRCSLASREFGSPNAGSQDCPQPREYENRAPPATVRAASREQAGPDRKSTRLNSSHVKISYAVFCLKKKKNKNPSYNQHNKS